PPAPPVPTNDLFGNRPASRTSRDVLGRRRPEQASARGFPDRNGERIADPDLWRRWHAIFPEAGSKAVRRLPQQSRDDAGIDVDDIVANLVLLHPPVDHLACGRTGGRQICTADQCGAAEANKQYGRLHRRDTVYIRCSILLIRGSGQASRPITAVGSGTSFPSPDRVTGCDK